VTTSMCRAVSTLFCAFLPIATAGFSQTAVRNSEEQRLIEIEHQLNEADAHHDAGQVSKYLDDAYLVKDTVMGGKVYDKSATLEAIRLDAKAAKNTGQSQSAPMLEGLKTAVLDGSALVVFNFTVGTEKQALHCQMTDTFLKRTDDWKLVGRAGTCH
jgi:hypothetical protein